MINDDLGRGRPGPDGPRRGVSVPRGLSATIGPRRAAVVAVLVAAFIWSSSYAVTKVALAEIPPLTIGALRFTAAAVLLGVMVRSRGPVVLPTARQRLHIGLAGLLGITAYFAFENLGVDLASASDATLIVASYPVITLLFELVWGTVSFSPIRFAGMAIAIGGVWIVVQNGGAGASEHHLVGDLLLLAGGVVWAVYNMMVGRDGSGASPIVVTYYQTLAGAGGFLVLSLTEVGRWSAPSGGAWLRVVFLAVFCSVVAFLFYNHGLRMLAPSVAVNLLNIVPFTGLMWAVLLAGERLVGLQVLGGAIVIAGVTLGLYRAPTERKDEEENVGHRRDEVCDRGVDGAPDRARGERGQRSVGHAGSPGRRSGR